MKKNTFCCLNRAPFDDSSSIRKCDFCDKEFTRYQGLEAHKKIVHSKKSFSSNRHPQTSSNDIEGKKDTDNDLNDSQIGNEDGDQINQQTESVVLGDPAKHNEVDSRKKIPEIALNYDNITVRVTRGRLASVNVAELSHSRHF